MAGEQRDRRGVDAEAKQRSVSSREGEQRQGRYNSGELVQGELEFETADGYRNGGDFVVSIGVRVAVARGYAREEIACVENDDVQNGS